jgi:hypothetical protein
MSHVYIYTDFYLSQQPSLLKETADICSALRSEYLLTQELKLKCHTLCSCYMRDQKVTY